MKSWGIEKVATVLEEALGVNWECRAHEWALGKTDIEARPNRDAVWIGTYLTKTRLDQLDGPHVLIAIGEEALRLRALVAQPIGETKYEARLKQSTRPHVPEHMFHALMDGDWGPKQHAHPIPEDVARAIEGGAAGPGKSLPMGLSPHDHTRWFVKGEEITEKLKWRPRDRTTHDWPTICTGTWPCFDRRYAEACRQILTRDIHAEDRFQSDPEDP